MQTIQSRPSWQLASNLQSTPQGHHLIISRFVATARRSEHQVKFSGTFSTSELRDLQALVSAALEGQAVEAPQHVGSMLTR
ncbi:MAG: hypothetical protein ABIR55_17775 [Burkholderiaceae bacterium]